MSALVGTVWYSATSVAMPEKRQTLIVINSIDKCASIAADRLIKLVLLLFVIVWFGSIWFVLSTTHLFDVIAVLLGLLFVAFGLLLEQGLKTASKHYKFRHTIYGIRFTKYDMWCERIGFLYFWFQEFGVWCLSCWIVVVVVVVWCGIDDRKFGDSMYVYIEIDVCTSIVLTWLWVNEITLDTRHYRDEYFKKIPKYQLRR